ncbi:MAG: site-specific DNA-methyltransferase [Verrucomicrobiae bacterium]|nr:site-specific DNA-methyltransferase [Verrucomicrobiae bacterium]
MPITAATPAHITESVHQAANGALEEAALGTVPDQSKDVVVVSTHFDVSKRLPDVGQPHRLTPDTESLLRESVRMLRIGGLLFVYGIPHDLAFIGERLSLMDDETRKMIFKYWIVLDIDDAPRADFLKPSHQGLLMFLKSKPGRKTAPPFHLNKSHVRIPHQKCSACGQFLKDWGGKSELMHDKGTVLSDVWRDLPRRPIRDCAVPPDVIKRIHELTWCENIKYQHVLQRSRCLEIGGTNEAQPPTTDHQSRCTQWNYLGCLETDKIYAGDCVTFLNRAKTLHPDGFFDLAFADPPYNLQKPYADFSDALAPADYIKLCNSWLEGMVETLKPGGSLFVLNLPKWAIHHATFLSRRLEFRHWIAWDASGEPRGKLSPSHYALLYFTKPGGAPTFNYTPLGSASSMERVSPPDAPKYCLRPKCVKQRKEFGQDDKVELSDVWFDIQRLKHAFDDHPCQLPEALMERLLLLASRSGDKVFDPFGGTGTTAIASIKQNRRYVLVEQSEKYRADAEAKVAAFRENPHQQRAPHRRGTRRPRRRWSQKAIVRELKQLARKLGRMPAEPDINAHDSTLLQKIDGSFRSRNEALKRCRLVLPAPS